MEEYRESSDPSTDAGRRSARPRAHYLPEPALTLAQVKVKHRVPKVSIRDAGVDELGYFPAELYVHDAEGYTVAIYRKSGRRWVRSL